MRFSWFSVPGLLLLASGFAQEGPGHIRFETEVGLATFDHRGHQTRLGIGCDLCHHQAEQGVKRPCGGCHKGRVEAEKEGGAPAYFDVKMKLCRGCHLAKREKEGNPKAPIHCADCHDIREKAREEASGSGDLRAAPPAQGADEQGMH